MDLKIKKATSLGLLIKKTNYLHVHALMLTCARPVG